MSPDAAAQWLGDANPDDGLFEVLPENWDIVMTFMRLQTQWKHGAMGGTLGLDYPGVESALRMMELWGRRGELFDGIQIMEAAALPLLNPKQ